MLKHYVNEDERMPNHDKQSGILQTYWARQESFGFTMFCSTVGQMLR